MSDPLPTGDLKGMGDAFSTYLLFTSWCLLSQPWDGDINEMWLMNFFSQMTPAREAQEGEGLPGGGGAAVATMEQLWDG